nr:MAG TPA: Transglycosylase SLT domain [Herelleviridae sp.]
MVNTADMKRLIIKIASEEGINPAIALAIAEQESGFNPNARNKSSREDSMGMFQINTKAHPDYKGGFNPEANTRYAIRMIKNLLQKTNGNIPQAMAAYNGGWGGKNSTQAQNYAKQAFGRIGKYASVSNNASKIAMNYDDASNPILKGGVTGMAANLNIPNPERPNYKDLFANTVTDPTGLTNAKITPREEMALRNIATPVQAPADIRPMIQVGTNEDGTPQLVTASQYNDMLNQLDTERILQVNQQLQANLPAMSKAEIQLGGQNAYDTMKGLRDEYNQALANDPRWDLVRLTPEQALDAMNVMKAKQGAGTLGDVSREKYYQMMNSLQNYQTPIDNAYDLTNQEYLAQLANMKQFQTAALTLAQGNQQLAQELMKQAQAGNGDVINALQKTQEARMKQEADYQKQIQSDYGTMLNTQRTGLNTYFNQLPITEANAVNAQNQFNLGRYGTDAGVYGTNVTTAKDLIMPQIKSDVEANSPVVQEQLRQGQQKVGIQQQNADTARAGAAGNIIANGMFNPEGFSAATQTVPSIRNILGQPTADTSNNLFGLTPQQGNSPQMFKFMDLFRTDD